MVNYNENVYTRRGTDGRDHIPALPFWVAIIRVFQLLFAFLVMILTAVASSDFGFDASTVGFGIITFAGYSMSWFTFAWTILFLLYIFVTPLWFPKFYLSWAQLGLEFLTVIFWLSTFALLADEGKWWSLLQTAINEEKQAEQLSGLNSTDFSDTPGLSGVLSDFSKEESGIKCSRAAIGLSALTWLLFVVTFIVFALFLNKHRAANGSTGFGGLSITRNDNSQVEKGQPQVELRNVPEHQQQIPLQQNYQDPPRPYEGA